MYGDQHPEGTLDDDTLVFHLDVDSHAFSGRCQVCAIWILSTSLLTPSANHPSGQTEYSNALWRRRRSVSITRPRWQAGSSVLTREGQRGNRKSIWVWGGQRRRFYLRRIITGRWVIDMILAVQEQEWLTFLEY